MDWNAVTVYRDLHNSTHWRMIIRSAFCYTYNYTDEMNSYPKLLTVMILLSHINYIPMVTVNVTKIDLIRDNLPVAKCRWQCSWTCDVSCWWHYRYMARVATKWHVEVKNGGDRRERQSLSFLSATLLWSWSSSSQWKLRVNAICK